MNTSSGSLPSHLTSVLGNDKYRPMRLKITSDCRTGIGQLHMNTSRQKSYAAAWYSLGFIAEAHPPISNSLEENATVVVVLTSPGLLQVSIKLVLYALSMLDTVTIPKVVNVSS